MRVRECSPFSHSVRVMSRTWAGANSDTPSSARRGGSECRQVTSGWTKLLRSTDRTCAQRIRGRCSEKTPDGSALEPLFRDTERYHPCQSAKKAMMHRQMARVLDAIMSLCACRPSALYHRNNHQRATHHHSKQYQSSRLTTSPEKSCRTEGSVHTRAAGGVTRAPSSAGMQGSARSRAAIARGSDAKKPYGDNGKQFWTMLYKNMPAAQRWGWYAIPLPPTHDKVNTFDRTRCIIQQARERRANSIGSAVIKETTRLRLSFQRHAAQPPVQPGVRAAWVGGG